MAPKFADNIILTKTERLMMSNRPPDPKNARNKNVLVVGGSGSGKTRFWLKPNLLQCHSSYVVTDPKGSIVVECGNALLKNGYKLKILNTMYEFDLDVLNSERAYITNTMTVSGAADDCAAKETSDFKQYEKAVTVTDTYHETKSRFAWIGEIENEQLLTALETLKVEDLEIITMYAYEGYDITEISKVYGVSRPTISIKIKRITKFLKNFNFNATN